MIRGTGNTPKRTSKPPENRRTEALPSSPSSTNGGQFKPGTSGNPGGRPKAVRELLELARSEVPASFDLAVKLRDDEGQDSRVRLEAAKFLTSYGLGAPPKNPIEDDDEPGKKNPLAGLTPEQIAALAEMPLAEH